MRASIVIPVMNQLHYTRQCVESLLQHGTDPASILVVDNGSVDDTPAWLASMPQIRSVRNAVNLGCGGAWTQGAMLGDSEWVVLLNNDIVSGHAFVPAMLDAAEREGLEVVSCAMVERDLDYPLEAFTAEFVAKMGGVVRRGWFHGVCFAVRRTVFERIGFLDTDRLLYGREDSEFLYRCRRNGVPVGTVGAALLHHFGSITQNAIKQQTGVRKMGDHRYFYAKVGLGWWGRQRAKFAR
jgi:GT2 family glycosyltransferase